MIDITNAPYNADPSGATDSTAAINAALAAGGASADTGGSPGSCGGDGLKDAGTVDGSKSARMPARAVIDRITRELRR
jgi:hypothetical protein